MNRLRTTFLAALLGTSLLLGNASAQAQELTLCWAQWDPANALVELSKDFTAKTGISMKFDLISWTSYADRFSELGSLERARCGKSDLIIGDSQWLGGSASNGNYVKLNDFFEKEGIRMDDFLETAVYAYSTWPKGSPNYYALPLMADAVGWTYRKDWFENADLKKEFKAMHGRKLAPPKTWAEFMDVAKFFQGREIDGKKVHGAYIFTEHGSEGITMGVNNVLYPFGFEYQNPKKPYELEGFVNSTDAVKGLELYKELYKCCTAPGMTNAYMGEGLDVFRSGQVAMQMNWFAFFPGLHKEMGSKIGFFANPSAKTKGVQLNGQAISVMSRSDQKDNALQYLKWFAQAEVQKKWWAMGGYSTHKAVLFDPNFPKSKPFAAEYLKAMQDAKDFWQEPIYATLLLDMQKRIHDYVVADKGTAKEALDKLVKDWTLDFKDAASAR